MTEVACGLAMQKVAYGVSGIFGSGVVAAMTPLMSEPTSLVVGILCAFGCGVWLMTGVALDERFRGATNRAPHRRVEE